VQRMFKLDDVAERTWMRSEPRAPKDPTSLMRSPLEYPIGIWTLPEIGYIGRTKERALADGWASVGEAVALYGQTIRGRVQGLDTGLLKLVFSKPDGVILGVHIFGEDACELVHYATALAQSGKTVRQVLGTTFAAVTYHELFQIAATQGVEILEGDAWSDILQQIAGDSSQISVSALLAGLRDAGMNREDEQEVEDTLKADLDFLPDVQVDVDKARLVLRKFRIPPKYRMGVAWREQFDPALGKEVVRQRAYNMFCGLDSDGSGRLDHAELLQGLQDRGLNIGDEACRDLLASSSNSGDIGFEEFWEIVQSLQDVPFFRKQEVGVSSVGRRG